MKRYSGYIISALITFALGTAVFVTYGLSAQAGFPTDPFQPYTAIAPGQPVPVLEGYTCGTVDDDQAQSQNYCYIQPEEGPIASVTIFIEGQKVSAVWYKVRDLRMGDVARHWGRPKTVYVGSSSYVARWEHGMSATAPTSGWVTLQTPVQFITLSPYAGV